MRACVRAFERRAPAVAEQTERYQMQLMCMYVGGSQKQPTHTIVPEAPYQMQMLADKEPSGIVPKTMTVSRQLRGKTWHLDLTSSEQLQGGGGGWGPSFLLGRSQHHDTVPTA
jgi:hypothetical protein